MSFFQSLFSAAPAAATPAAANPQGTNAAEQTNQQSQGTETSSPMDSFKDLWQNTTTEGTDPNSPEGLFSVDPKALNDTVGKMNFLGSIPPKVQEALKNGGPEAVQANLYLMNQVAQQSFAQSAQATAKIVEAALAKQAEAFESRVSEVVKKTGMNEELRSANPVFAHPAAEPILQGIQAQLIKKHPGASQRELAQMAQNYLATFAGEITGANKSKAPASKADTDFSNFFD